MFKEKRQPELYLKIYCSQHSETLRFDCRSRTVNAVHEAVAVYYENHTKPINALSTQ